MSSNGGAGSLLDGQVVVVAGVGPGLGAALVRCCAAHGASVVAAARNADRLKDIVGEIEDQGGRALAVPTDLANPSACAALIDRAQGEYGVVDALVFNAFQDPVFEALETKPVEEVRSSLDVNLFAGLTLAQLVIPGMRSRQSGSILFVNSAILRQTRPAFGAYKLAKHALLGLAQNLAAEVGPSGIRVNSIAPSWIWGPPVETFLHASAAQRGLSFEQVRDELCSTIPLRRFTTPEEIADAAAFMISDLARAVTGQCLDVNAGEYCH